MSLPELLIVAAVLVTAMAEDVLLMQRGRSHVSTAWWEWILMGLMPLLAGWIAWLFSKLLGQYVDKIQGCPKSACPQCGHYTGRAVGTVHPACGGTLRELTPKEVELWPNLPDDARNYAGHLGTMTP